MRRSFCHYWLMMLSVFLLAPAMAQVREEVVVLPSRTGVQTPYLLSHAAGATPTVVFVLLSGGSGEHNLAQRGEVVQVFNDQRLLARTRTLFAGSDAAAALVDAPSDQNRLGDAFRKSASHVQDIQAVLVDLRQRFPRAARVLVGHSNGTMSAAQAAAAADSLADRVVLISGRFVAHWFAGSALSDFDFSRLRVPVLLVHHMLDDCSVTPYQGARDLSQRFPLISVDGPPGLAAASCSSLGPHGLEGREAAVVEAIRGWVSGLPVPAEIR